MKAIRAIYELIFVVFHTEVWEVLGEYSEEHDTYMRNFLNSGEKFIPEKKNIFGEVFFVQAGKKRIDIWDYPRSGFTDTREEWNGYMTVRKLYRPSRYTIYQLYTKYQEQVYNS